MFRVKTIWWNLRPYRGSNYLLFHCSSVFICFDICYSLINFQFWYFTSWHVDSIYSLLISISTNCSIHSGSVVWSFLYDLYIFDHFLIFSNIHAFIYSLSEPHYKSGCTLQPMPGSIEKSELLTIELNLATTLSNHGQQSNVKCWSCLCRRLTCCGECSNISEY